MSPGLWILHLRLAPLPAYSFGDTNMHKYNIPKHSSHSRGRGYSVTALTPPAALEKVTALANSHWICTGNIFNLRAIFGQIQHHFSCNLLMIKRANMWALYLERIVWFHEDFTLTFNGQHPLRVGREISECHRNNKVATQFVTSVWPGECSSYFLLDIPLNWRRSISVSPFSVTTDFEIYIDNYNLRGGIKKF